MGVFLISLWGNGRLATVRYPQLFLLRKEVKGDIARGMVRNMVARKQNVIEGTTRVARRLGDKPGL
jgi:hypothetical protein